MIRARLLAGATAAAVAVAGCGENAQKRTDDKPSRPDAPSGAAAGSSLDCMERSVISAHRYSSARDEGVENGVRPLFTPGAKGAEILTGQLGAVVIEYPSEAAAAQAARKARASRVLTSYVSPARIAAVERTLFIDYAKTPHVRKIVVACARHPADPPPTP